MDLLLVGEVSVALLPVRFLGIRPSAAYFISTAAVYDTTAGLQDVRSVLGRSRPFIRRRLRRGNLVRSSPAPASLVNLPVRRVRREWPWSVLGGCAEFSFGQARAKGAYAAMVVRNAKLGITRRPDSPSSVTMNDLDLTSVLFCGGFQMGL